MNTQWSVLSRRAHSLAMTALFAGLVAMPGWASAQRVEVTKGTDVPLVFDQGLSSKTAQVGDRVKLHVTQDVMVDGKTIIREGTPVTGIIQKVDKRKRYGINARIQLALNPVKDVTATMIPLEPRGKGNQLKGSRTDTAALATGGGALLLGPVGLVGGLFVVGKPVTIHPGDKLMSWVSQDVSVHAR